MNGGGHCGGAVRHCPNVFRRKGGYVGSVDIKYRAEILDAAGNATYGAWIDFPFTMVAPATQAHVDDLDLVDNTGSTADDTYDPRVSGQVGGPLIGALVDVQFVVGDGAGRHVCRRDNYRGRRRFGYRHRQRGGRAND